METTKILRERFEQFLTDEVDLPLGDFEFILPFIEQEIKLAEKRGEANMKQRVQNLLDDNDDYMDFERLFHYL